MCWNWSGKGGGVRIYFHINYRKKYVDFFSEFNWLCIMPIDLKRLFFIELIDILIKW